MAKIYSMKDGPPKNNVGRIFEIELAKLYKHIPKLRATHLPENPLSFNKESPSLYADKVIVEVSASETDNKEFKESGSYILEGVRTEDVNISAIF